MGHDHDVAPAADLAAQLHLRGGPFGRASRPSRPGDELHERLSARWPEAALADYPALARPGSAQVQAPDFWQPEAKAARPDQRALAITIVAECPLMPK